MSIEELADALKNLSRAERLKLQSLIEREALKDSNAEELESLQVLLEESERQVFRGEVRPSENILREARKKYGL